jgi:hypothetical protein
MGRPSPSNDPARMSSAPVEEIPMKRNALAAALLLAALAIPSVARGWNAHGHMTIALIAYRGLDPAVRSKVDELLKSHPSFARFQAKRPAHFTDEGAWIFMMAATWPDLIKDRNHPDHAGFDPDDPDAPPRAFHKGVHDVEHFVDMPFGQDGVAGKPPGPRTILTYLPKNVSVLKEGDDPRARAVALSWVIHLVGDVHQPLHCASRFNADFPDGDQGGNLFVIQPADSVRQVKLHAFWDAALGSSSSASTIDHDARAIMDDDSLQAGSLPELSAHKLPKEWAAESFKLAVEIAYEDGTIPGIPQHQLDEDPNAPIPTLSPRSRARATDVAERRAALAAFRLKEAISKSLD